MSKPHAKKASDIRQFVNPEKPVRCHLNIRKKVISVSQGGIVLCHADNVFLKDFKCVVSESQRQKVLRTKRKNVHSFIVGTLSQHPDISQLPFLWERIRYNPYNTEKWVDLSGNYVKCGEFCYLSPQMVLAHNFLFDN